MEKSVEKSTIITSALELKEKGNESFRAKRFEEAESFFSEAINLLLGNKPIQDIEEIEKMESKETTTEEDSLISVCFLNRAINHGSQMHWAAAFSDARRALNLSAVNSKHYYKCYFRLVKSLIELKRFKSARLYLDHALKNCKQDDVSMRLLEGLESDLFLSSGVALRPSPRDFEILEELGDGNFSKVVKVRYRRTGAVYAIKTIERLTVDRMKRRHPNIHNEILMEKRALNKLEHPNIVELLCTFQDGGSLYFQMEFVGGCDLWTLLQEEDEAAQDEDAEEGGLDLQPLRRPRTLKQVGCHWSQAVSFFRDLLAAVEHMHRFGIVHRDLKPENVMVSTSGHLKVIDLGTAKDLLETDLNGPEFVGTAEYMSPSTVRSRPSGGIGVEADLWALGVVLFQMLLGYTPFNAASPYLTFLRIKRSRLALHEALPPPMASMLRLLLEPDDAARFRNCCLLDADGGEGLAQRLRRICYDPLRRHPLLTCDPARWPATGDRPAEDRPQAPGPSRAVPLLQELCVRAVGRACLLAARLTAESGGVVPALPWLQGFRLKERLGPQLLFRVRHFLLRMDKLHLPGVFRLLCAAGSAGTVEARCTRCDAASREVLGFSRSLQGHFHSSFFFLHIADASFGRASGGADCEAERGPLSEAVAAINRLRPRFVVVTGNMTAASPGQQHYEQQSELFRRTIARLSDSIAAVFVPGAVDVGTRPCPSSLAAYRERFGADFFGFWFGGLRCIVLNTPLMIHPENAEDEAALQEAWLAEELEQAKLCSCHMALFAFHRWFRLHLLEDDWAAGEGSEEVVPREGRLKWLRQLQHHKVRLSLSAQPADVSASPEGARRPFPAARAQDRVETPCHEGRGAEESDSSLKPSEMLQQRAGAGEGDEGSEPDSDPDQDFPNVEDCEGPELLHTASIAGDPSQPQVLAAFVTEYDLVHRHFGRGHLPKSAAELTYLFEKP